MEFIFLIVLTVVSPAIIATAGGMYTHIRDSKKKLDYKMMIEERRLEEIKQENYLLENESMRQELGRIRESRRALEEQMSSNSRWLIEDTMKEVEKESKALQEKKRVKEVETSDRVD